MNYMQRILEERENAMHAVERATRQFEYDCWVIALYRYAKISLGYQRIKEMSDLQDQVRREYGAAITQGVEQDVVQEHMDRELEEILRGHAELIPFGRRYPEIKEITYGGKKR